MKQNRLLVLKKMIGKRVFIISSYDKYKGYVGHVEDVSSENELLVNSGNSLDKISIFDVRSIPYEF
jgi:ferredoxin-fold anticodon binding domain-containing protein